MARVNGRRDARPRVEHIETIDPADVPRFAQIGVVPSFMPIHADPSTSDVWMKAIGPERSSRGFAWRSLQKTGVPLVFSSDWPATISVNPLEGIHCAVTRQDRDGSPPGGWFPAERVSLETALRAYTYGGAYASFEERDKGTLRPGKLADFVILSRDLFRIPARDILATKVLLTAVGGKIVFNELTGEPGKPRPPVTPVAAGR
jgi:predicted amidohydrolase YtcJ